PRRVSWRYMTDIMGQGTPVVQGSRPDDEREPRERGGDTQDPARLPSSSTARDGAAGPTADELRDAERFAREILPSASRTFAISIRMLPGVLGRAVLASYLICRIADTIEDERT